MAYISNGGATKTTFTGWVDDLGNRIFEGDILSKTDDSKWQVIRNTAYTGKGNPTDKNYEGKFTLVNINNPEIEYNLKESYYSTDGFINISNDIHNDDNSKIDLLEEVFTDDCSLYSELSNKINQLQGYLKILSTYKPIDLCKEQNRINELYSVVF